MNAVPLLNVAGVQEEFAKRSKADTAVPYELVRPEASRRLEEVAADRVEEPQEPDDLRPQVVRGFARPA